MRHVVEPAGPANVVCNERRRRSAGTSFRSTSLPTALTRPPKVARPCDQSSLTVTLPVVPSNWIEPRTSENSITNSCDYRARDCRSGSAGASLFRSSQQLRAVRHRSLRHREHDMSVCIVKPGHEHFGPHRPDLLRREVHDGDHLPAKQVCPAVVLSNLRAGLPDADLGTEVDTQPPRRLTRLGKVEHLDNR